MKFYSSTKLHSLGIFRINKRVWTLLIKHVLNCGNLYIYTTVVQEVYNLDHSLEIQDVEDLAAVATRHLDYSNKGIRQKAVWLWKRQLWNCLEGSYVNQFHFIYLLQDSPGRELYLLSYLAKSKHNLGSTLIMYKSHVNYFREVK